MCVCVCVCVGPAGGIFLRSYQLSYLRIIPLFEARKLTTLYRKILSNPTFFLTFRNKLENVNPQFNSRVRGPLVCTCLCIYAFATTLKISACQSFLHGETPVYENRQNITKYNPKHELTGRKQRSS